MGFTPSVPISLQIRKIIFEKYNNVETRFTNDEIFEQLQKGNDIDKEWIIDDMENYFQEICDSGLVRNIAQNFTTIWYKLFEPMEKFHCNSCNNDIYLGKEENKLCPNQSCKASI